MIDSQPISDYAIDHYDAPERQHVGSQDADEAVRRRRGSGNGKRHNHRSDSPGPAARPNLDPEHSGGCNLVDLDHLSAPEPTQAVPARAALEDLPGPNPPGPVAPDPNEPSINLEDINNHNPDTYPLATTSPGPARSVPSTSTIQPGPEFTLLPNMPQDSSTPAPAASAGPWKPIPPKRPRVYPAWLAQVIGGPGELQRLEDRADRPNVLHQQRQARRGNSPASATPAPCQGEDHLNTVALSHHFTSPSPFLRPDFPNSLVDEVARPIFPNSPEPGEGEEGGIPRRGANGGKWLREGDGLGGRWGWCKKEFDGFRLGWDGKRGVVSVLDGDSGGLGEIRGEVWEEEWLWGVGLEGGSEGLRGLRGGTRGLVEDEGSEVSYCEDIGRWWEVEGRLVYGLSIEPLDNGKEGSNGVTCNEGSHIRPSVLSRIYGLGVEDDWGACGCYEETMKSVKGGRMQLILSRAKCLVGDGCGVGLLALGMLARCWLDAVRDGGFGWYNTDKWIYEVSLRGRGRATERGSGGDALSWVMEEGIGKKVEKDMFSFRWCCWVLDLDEEEVRKVILVDVYEVLKRMEVEDSFGWFSDGDGVGSEYYNGLMAAYC